MMGAQAEKSRVRFGHETIPLILTAIKPIDSVEAVSYTHLDVYKRQGYWDPLLALFAHMREQEFVPDALRINFLVADRVEDVLPRLRDAAGGVTDAEETMAIPAERL